MDVFLCCEGEDLKHLLLNKFSIILELFITLFMMRCVRFLLSLLVMKNALIPLSPTVHLHLVFYNVSQFLAKWEILKDINNKRWIKLIDIVNKKQN